MPERKARKRAKKLADKRCGWQVETCQAALAFDCLKATSEVIAPPPP